MTILFALLVFGSIFSSLWESGMLLSYAVQPSPTALTDLFATLYALPSPEEFSPTTITSQLPTSTPAYLASPTWTATFLTSTMAICPPPPGWMQIVINTGDTLRSLAHTYGTSVEMLIQVNCLVAESLVPGSYLFVPARTPTASPTRTVYVCGPPVGWVTYVIRPGDTLYRLALAFRTTVTQLQIANCMGSSTLLIVGNTLYVPNVPTSTSSPIASPYPTWTSSLTFTPTPSFTPSFTAPPSQTSTATASPSYTATLTYTSTPAPTSTASPSPSPSPTETMADSGGG